MLNTLGGILIDQGLISSEQLEAALSKQKYINAKWEHIRPEMSYIKSYGLLTALSEHFNMPILSLKNYKSNPQLQKVMVNVML